VPGAQEAIAWDEEALENALKRAVEGVIEAHGARLSSDQLKRLLDAAPEDHEHSDRHLLRQADFDGAAFEDNAGFRHVIFGGDADFRGANFGGRGDFRGAIFSGEADFRGAIFSGDADFGGAILSGDADFRGATFSGRADFGGAIFSGNADFVGAIFSGYAGFGKATFERDGGFREATFARGAGFGGAIFRGVAYFGEAMFSGVAYFEEATFEGDAYFKGKTNLRGATFELDADFPKATFGGNAYFDGATFGGDADFPGASFGGDAEFRETTFSGDADFRETTFKHAHFPETTFDGNAHFDGATFDQTSEFGPIRVSNRLWLDRAVFVKAVRIEASARRASFARAVFRAGADVRLRWAEVWLEDAEFAEPSLLAGLQARRTLEGGRTFLGWEEPAANGTWRRLDEQPKQFDPCVLSVGGAKLAQLTLSEVNLKTCRFAGAHGLDELGMERVEFAQPPDGWRRIRLRPVRWTRRRTIAEEHQWRTQERHGSGWDQSDRQVASRRSISDSSGSSPPASPWPPEEPDPVEAEQVAGLYRALRKGREDSKDEPGAGDFYYGEMEMRRRSAPFGERSILWFYWLVSGYGLRASRALLALAFTIAVLGAIPLALWGFRPDRPYGRALLFALESSISLLRAPEAKLTASGELIQIFLRIAGPLFFGLAVLSLRGRVKR
jgi:uncharacterized protein YjbI with pentapeptide repeats